MTASNTPYPIQEKLAQLEESLLQKLPNMPVILREIHSALKKDPDVVTVLADEECSILVQGLLAQTKTSIATAAVSKRKTKSLKNTTVDDL